MAIETTSQAAWVGSGDIRLTDEGQQLAPGVAALADGRYLIVWLEYVFIDSVRTGQVHAQFIDASGAEVGDELLLSAGPAAGIPTVAGLSNGGFVATWEVTTEAGPASPVVYTSRLFDASGSPVSPEFQVDALPDVDQGVYAEVTSLTGGGFVVEWFGNPGGPTFWGPSLQLYDAAGAPIGGNVAVGYAGDGSVIGGAIGIGGAAIAASPDGGYYTVWSGHFPFQPGIGSANILYVQRFDSLGQPLSDPIAAYTMTSSSFVAFGGQFDGLDAAVLESGDLVISFIGQRVSDSTNHVITQRFDAAGNLLGGELDISVGFSTLLDNDVTALSDGGFVVSWLDWGAVESRIFAQRYDSAGALVGDAVLVGTAAGALPHYSVSATADGGAVFVWEDNRLDGGDIFVELFLGSGQPGSALQGGNGTDDLVGTAGVDTLSGGNGRDFLTGLAGNDILDGGRGLDTAIYFEAMSGYVISRTDQGFTVSGPEGLDTLIGIERLQFSDAEVALNEHAPEGLPIATLVGLAPTDGMV
jgi:Ca2+-binding RTX toxin-like protein